MNRPKPQNYGLPADFDWNTVKGGLETREAVAGCISGIVGWTIGIGLAVLATGMLFGILGNWAFLGMPFAMFFGISGTCELSNRLIMYLMLSKKMRFAKLFGQRLEEWEYICLETGIGFWATQRGVAFELALAKLFRNRGCKVTLTSTTGDGGVDLVIQMVGGTYWGQCKGQQGPVSVAIVREIAGVCSRSSSYPVVFAVNGFTRPAQDAARNLDVLLYDASDIATLAARDSIQNLRILGKAREF